MAALWHKGKFSVLILYTMHLHGIPQRPKVLPDLLRNALTLYWGTIEVEVPILPDPL